MTKELTLLGSMFNQDQSHILHVMFTQTRIFKLLDRWLNVQLVINFNINLTIPEVVGLVSKAVGKGVRIGVTTQSLTTFWPEIKEAFKPKPRVVTMQHLVLMATIDRNNSSFFHSEQLYVDLSKLSASKILLYLALALFLL